MKQSLQSDLDRATFSSGARELAIAVVVLLGAFLIRSALVFWTWQQGFVEYNADGFSRVIRGFEWMQSPRWEVELWLPLHFWLYGALFWLWDDLFLASRALNMALSAATLVAIFLIARTLVDWRVGAIAVALVSMFPYEVWLSFSGMSEPLYHALIAWAVLGFVYWWSRANDLAIIGGAFAIAAATAVRYEAWFFAAAFVAIFGLSLALNRRFNLNANLSHFSAPATAVAVAFSFILLWVQQNWAAHGDALAFARGTEQAKLAEEPANIEASLIERITYFPVVAFNTAPLLVVAGIASSIALLYMARERWWPLLALVWGQALLLVSATSLFSSQGPGAERYLLINIVLLCLPIAGVAVLMIERAGRPRTVLALASLAIVVASFIPEWLSPPTGYPSADSLTLASEIRQHLEAEDDGGGVIVLLPPVPDERFNEGYALRVLSGAAGRVEVTDVPARLHEAVQQDSVSMWVMDDSLDQREPPGVERWNLGGFVGGFPPPPASASGVDSPVSAGFEISFDAEGFENGEMVASWWTAPDESVEPGQQYRADETGAVDSAQARIPNDAISGTWTLTLSGTDSQRQAFVHVEVR